MSGHTLGPWIVNGFGGAFEVLARTRGGVAVSSREVLGDDIADARLIAAAPDLYRELKALVVALEPALNAGEIQVAGLATLNAAWLALAKAEGKE